MSLLGKNSPSQIPRGYTPEHTAEVPSEPCLCVNTAAARLVDAEPGELIVDVIMRQRFQPVSSTSARISTLRYLKRDELSGEAAVV